MDKSKTVFADSGEPMTAESGHLTWQGVRFIKLKKILILFAKKIIHIRINVKEFRHNLTGKNSKLI